MGWCCVWPRSYFFLDLCDFAKKSSIKSASPPYMKKMQAIKNEYKSGKLVKINKKEIAIFRYGEKVFAIDEKCPHVGKHSLSFTPLH